MQLPVALSWVVDQEGTLFQAKERISQILHKRAKSQSQILVYETVARLCKGTDIVDKLQIGNEKKPIPVPSRINQFR